MKAGYLGGGVAQSKVAEMELAGVGEERLLASQSVREKEGEDNWFSRVAQHCFPQVVRLTVEVPVLDFTLSMEYCPGTRPFRLCI